MSGASEEVLIKGTIQGKIAGIVRKDVSIVVFLCRLL
jgi:hypothetical protein